jgi:Fe-S cluster biogenesis protein NfuA
MPITRQTVDAALEPLRQGLRADGADLVVAAAEDTRIAVRLQLSDATCAECVSPATVLSRIIERALRGSFPELASFSFEDPRIES